MNTALSRYCRAHDWMDHLFGSSSPEDSWQPACDIAEENEHFLLSIDMPGIPKENISIEVEGNKLVVTGERKSESRDQKKGFTYSERKYGTFQRTFTLPRGLEAERIEAKFKDGVLELTLPKTEPAKAKQIKILDA